MTAVNVITCNATSKLRDPETIHEMLAAVMVHELGHMLLGEESHSSVGIMRPSLRRKDFEPASSLRFTRQQVKQMKALLTNRG